MDNKDFISIFKVETEDHLLKLDKGLVDLEKNPNNYELVKELNRESHTLKGSARILGYNEIEKIGHNMEDIFDKILQKSLKISSPIIEIMLEALDIIRYILDKIIKGETNDKDISKICKKLQNIVEGNTEIQAEKIEPSKKKAVEKGYVEEVVNIEKKEPLPPVSQDAQPKPVFVEEYIRVPLSRINKLLNLTGELVINKMKFTKKTAQVKKFTKLTREMQKRIFDIYERVKKEPLLRNNEILKLLNQCNADILKLKNESMILYDNISTESFHLDPVIDELQSKIKDIRMMPCSTIFEGFHRMIRDIASHEGKEVKFEITGDETKLDKKILESIKTPMMHILRNCIDHGIEKPEKRIALGKPGYGTIKISVSNEGDNVIIAVEDDGKGINIEEIKQTAVKKHLITKENLETMTEKEIFNIIFMNGFSTSPIITDVSGRGIGLDIVRRDIGNIKGRVNVISEVNKGTKFLLELPLTIAIDYVLLFKVQEMLFAISLSSIVEIREVGADEISTIEDRMAIQVREHIIPLVKLDEVLKIPVTQVKEKDEGVNKKIQEEENKYHTIIVSSLGKHIGFIVDDIVCEEEIFIKNLDEYTGKVSNVNGAAILGTGEVVVILDVADLIANSSLSHPALMAKKQLPKDKRKEKLVLVIDDALSARELEKSILELYGYRVDTAVDGVDGLSKTEKTKFDLIITDIQMPRMDGFELCKNIKKIDKNKDVPVVIVTSLEKEEDKRRGIEVGAAAYIVKSSFNQSNYIDTIERLIG